MKDCCKIIPRKNREVYIIQWGDRGARIVEDHYCTYTCKTCGNRIRMTLGEGFD